MNITEREDVGKEIKALQKEMAELYKRNMDLTFAFLDEIRKGEMCTCEKIQEEQQINTGRMREIRREMRGLRVFSGSNTEEAVST